jgi:hypothetical protein
VLLWLLGFTAVALSTWFQGWTLRLAPQRLAVFLGPPLCMAAALGWERMRAARPRWAHGITGAGALLGATSVAVGALCFQGPLGRAPGQGPLAELRADLMTDADADCLASLGPGRVMTPNAQPAFGDIVSLRGNRAIHGLGAWDHSDRGAYAISEALDAFYDPALPDAERLRIAREWGVDWVYCPDTVPVPDAIISVFDATVWLDLTAQSGRARLYRVRLPD